MSVNGSRETPPDLVYEPEDIAAMVGYWRRLYEFVVLYIPGAHGDGDCRWQSNVMNCCWSPPMKFQPFTPSRIHCALDLKVFQHSAQ
jgi:hypothetical protein